MPFVAAVETDLRGRPQIVRFDRVDNHGLHAIQRWRLRPSPRRAWCSQTAGRAFNSWATWCNVMSGISPVTARRRLNTLSFTGSTHCYQT